MTHFSDRKINELLEGRIRAGDFPSAVYLVGFEGELVWNETYPNGQPRRLLDVSRAEELFGFRARVNFEEGLRKTIDWYLQHRAELIK